MSKYQIEKWTEDESTDFNLEVEDIGPPLETEQGVQNYVEAVIPKGDHWQLFIREVLDDEDEIGEYPLNYDDWLDSI